IRAQRADGGWSDRAHPSGKPAGRTSARRRDPLLPGMLLPVAALAQYATRAASSAAASAGAAASASGAANEDGASKHEAGQDDAGVVTVLAGHSASGSQPTASA